MRKKTFQKLDLAAQRIADRLLNVRDVMNLQISIKKPYSQVKQFIMDNQEWIDCDMCGTVKMNNVCKTTRQVHYLTNEVLHRLRRNKFFRKPAASDSAQMLLPL